VAVITTGGPLGAVATKASLPLLAYPAAGPARASIGHGVTLLAGLLERAGALPLEAAEVEAAAEAGDAALAAWGPDVPTAENPAKQLAWALLDRLPVIEASGFLGVVARRWKTQLNENAKTAAAWEELPEATHNTVAGYAQPEALADHQLVVFLASDLDHPRDALRAELSGELLAEAGIGAQTVRIEGPGRFAQAITAIVLGDLVSAYLAVLYGTDPTPVDAIVRLADALAEATEDPEEAAASARDEDADTD
jgi:glucose/mannose-6-phosphate isomerase